ncbi:MAG: DNA translocase FtsK 4TM domain-containing protein, partial [Pseudomonadota bacterium]
MAQATRRRPIVEADTAEGWGRGYREGIFIACIAVALFLLAALASYDPRDPGWSFSGPAGPVENQMGVVGAWFADIFLFLFGYLAYLFPILITIAAVVLFRAERPSDQSTTRAAIRGAGFAMILASACALAAIHYGAQASLPLDAGGILGNLVGRALVSMFNFLGATLVLLAAFLTGISLFTRLSWLTVIDATGHLTLTLWGRGQQWLHRFRAWQDARRVRVEREEKREQTVKARVKRRTTPKPRIEPTLQPVQPSVRAVREKQVPLFTPSKGGMPPLDLL